MNNDKWTDATTYSRTDKERKPKAWRLTLPSLGIWIGSQHKDYPKQYVMHCAPLGIYTFPLQLNDDCDLQQVKDFAISICKREAAKIVNELNNIK